MLCSPEPVTKQTVALAVFERRISAPVTSSSVSALGLFRLAVRYRPAMVTYAAEAGGLGDCGFFSGSM